MLALSLKNCKNLVLRSCVKPWNEQRGIRVPSTRRYQHSGSSILPVLEYLASTQHRVDEYSDRYSASPSTRLAGTRRVRVSLFEILGESE